MNIQLQTAVPFPEHFSWKLSQQAYASHGLSNWTSGDVPAFMTGNTALAQQKMQLLASALAVQQKVSTEAVQDVHVLELGAGNGLFAWHFIQAFHAWAKEQAQIYRLHYYLSDAQVTALESLRAHPAYSTLFASEQLQICALDFLVLSESDPKSQNNLTHERLAALPPLDAIIANYLFCQLPFRFLSWQEQGCEEALLSSALKLPQTLLQDVSPAQQQALEQALGQAIQNPQAGIWPLAEPETALAPLKTLLADKYDLCLAALKACPEPFWSQLDFGFAFAKAKVPGTTARQQSWWTQQLQARQGQWLPCPVQALQALEVCCQRLKPHGLLMLSDKGHVDAEQGFREPPHPYAHGLHVSWPVYFPLLQAWLEKLGLQAGHSHNPLWTFHTLWASPANPALAAPLQSSFAAHFERHNGNQYAADLIDSAEDYLEQENWRKAAILYQQALQYRPRDARVLSQLISCLLELQAFAQAEAFLQSAVDDLWSEYDFAFQRGQVQLFQGNYAQALQDFENSLQNFGPAASTLYNLGLCQLLVQEHQQARDYFQAALELEPDFEIARLALETWHETFCEPNDLL